MNEMITKISNNIHVVILTITNDNITSNANVNNYNADNMNVNQE